MTANQAAKSEKEPGIQRLREVHVAAVNAGDANAWANCFAEDAVQMPPHFQANVGQAAIRGWGQGFLSMFACRFGLSVEEVRVDSNLAFERGRYSIQLTPKSGGDPMQENGKYITIYRRETGGDWKIARDIWNSDEPLPAGR